MTDLELARKAVSLRKDVTEIILRGKGGHFGGDFSVMEILVTLYYRHMNVGPDQVSDPDRDRFILSKGHSVEALYAVLCDRGFLTKELCGSFSQFGSPVIGHPTNKIRGIEMNSGSLGHGLSVGVGMALAARMQKRDYRTYVVMGDGELAEGSGWEGFMAGGHYRLDNLTAVIDRNGLQISGKTEDVMSQEPMHSRLADFGWHVIECDGNDVRALDRAFTEAKATKGMPSVVLAKTVKGCGYSVAENQAGWHHKVPSLEQRDEIMRELDERLEKLL